MCSFANANAIVLGKTYLWKVGKVDYVQFLRWWLGQDGNVGVVAWANNTR